MKWVSVWGIWAGAIETTETGAVMLEVLFVVVR